MMTPPWVHNLFRADFLRSVGLYVTRDRLLFVRLKKTFLKLSLVEQETRELQIGEDRQALSELTGWIAEDVQEIALKATHDSRERALKQAVVSLLPHFNPARDSLFLCVPQEQAIVQQLYLPSAAEGNLRQVLDYEIERQMPFRREDVYYDFLPTGRKGDKVGLYLFAIPKKQLAGILEVLSSFGIQPQGVETTVTAIANYLLFCKGAAASAAAVIGGYERSWDMIGVRSETDGWQSTPQLLFSHWLPQAQWAAGPAREWLRECLSLGPELYAWGDVEEFLRLDGDGAAKFADLVALGNQRLVGGATIAQEQVLPAFGAALRGVREAPFSINLLKPEVSREARWKTFSRLNVMLTALLALAVILWGASFPIKGELRLRQLQRENRKIEPAVQALRREEAQLEKLRKELTVLYDFDGRKGEVLRILEELTKIVPTSAYLSNFRYRDRVLEIQGSAENASALIPLLERSPMFENVGFNAPSNRGRDNRETFSLKANLELLKEAKAGRP